MWLTGVQFNRIERTNQSGNTHSHLTRNHRFLENTISIHNHQRLPRLDATRSLSATPMTSHFDNTAIICIDQSVTQLDANRFLSTTAMNHALDIYGNLTTPSPTPPFTRSLVSPSTSDKPPMLELGDPARDCACFREEWDRTTEEHERFLAFVNLDILLGRWTSMIVSLTRLLFATIALRDCVQWDFLHNGRF